RPHVVSRNQMAAGARTLGATEKQGEAQPRVPRQPCRHRHGLHRRLRPLVVVGVGAEVEVTRRPAAIPDRLALAVGHYLEFAARLWDGARRPRREARGVGRVTGRSGASRAERDEPGPAHRPPRCSDHENLMSTVRSNRPPEVSRNSTFSGPGAVARNVKEKNGFSATPCEVSKLRMVLPR